MPSLSSGVTVALRLAGFEARYGAGAMGPAHLLLALSWISDESLSARFDDPDKRRELAEEGEQLRERFAEAGIDPDELRSSLRAALSAHAREELLRGGVDDDPRGDEQAPAAAGAEDERTNSALTGMIRRAAELGEHNHAGVIELLRAILEQPLPGCREVFEVLGIDEPLYAFFPEIPRPRPEPSPDAHAAPDDAPEPDPDYDVDLDAPDHAAAGSHTPSSADPDPDTDADADADADADPDADPDLDPDARLVERTIRVPRRPRHAVDETRTPLLDRYGRDLTLLARQGTLPPLIGREQEMLSLARVLVRQRKANAVLVGEAGVGKTGIVEGLAARLTATGAPADLANVRIVELTMSALVAGTKYRGEFEERMEAVLREARDTPGLILFLDELHTVLGAGAATGATDAASILKPMLARGEIRVIGATTASEYHRHVEEDPALQRRFAVIWVEEPTRAEAVAILDGVAEHIARHHRVEIADDAPAAAVDLAMRYLPDQHLPDKAIDLLDQACAAARIPALLLPPPGGTAVPVPEARSSTPVSPQAVDAADAVTAAADPQGPESPHDSADPDGSTGPGGPVGPHSLDGFVDSNASIGLHSADDPTTPDAPIGPNGRGNPIGSNAPVSPHSPDDSAGPGAPVGPHGLDDSAGSSAPVDPHGHNSSAGSNAPVGPHGLDDSAGPGAPVDPHGHNSSAGSNAPVGSHGLDSSVNSSDPVGPHALDSSDSPPDGPAASSPAIASAPPPPPTPTPIIRVSRADLISVVAERARIPVERVALTEAQRLLDLETHLSRRVIGQQAAVSAVSEAVRASRAGLGDPNRPIGVFLLAGPTGSGKTELAKALAEFLFDDERRLIHIDMSEYQDKYTVSRLLGAPPGYLGHDREGQLSGPLRAHPHSVVLFDEVEKAHPEVLDLFLQILDEGRLTDARGRRVSFTETVVMMTTNLGYERGTNGTMGFRAQGRGVDPMPSAGPARIMAELRRVLRPELLGRIGNVVVFNPLPRAALEAVLTKLIARVHDRLADRALTLDLDRPARDLLLDAGTDPRSGARALEQTVERLLVQPLGRELLSGAFPDGSLIRVTADDGATITPPTPGPDAATAAAHATGPTTPAVQTGASQVSRISGDPRDGASKSSPALSPSSSPALKFLPAGDPYASSSDSIAGCEEN
jgi:ATP-dependent Clp protease ATP-binding subunit ClpA